jgi:hypothetical protein
MKVDALKIDPNLPNGHFGRQNTWQQIPGILLRKWATANSKDCCHVTARLSIIAPIGKGDEPMPTWSAVTDTRSSSQSDRYRA